MLRSWTQLAALAVLAAAAASVSAQAYPVRPVRLLVPFGPGGVGDITARVVAQKIGASLGQQIVVDNRPGAGGIVASEIVAKAAPDGYTLLLLNNAHAVSMSLFKSMAGVAMVHVPFTNTGAVLTVHEAGVPGYEVMSWNGLGAPAGTPKPVINRLNQAIVEALAMPDVKQRFAEMAVDTRPDTPEGFRKLVASEIAKWGKVIETARIPKQ